MKVLALFTASESRGPVESQPAVQLRAGCGIVGDRHYRRNAKPAEQITLIESEAIADFKDDPARAGYGALAFRPQDKALRDAVNAELKQWLGSEEHLKTIEPFGFDRSNVTDKTAAELCGA